MMLNEAMPMVSNSLNIMQTFNENEGKATVLLENNKIRKEFPEIWIFDTIDVVLVEF